VWGAAAFAIAAVFNMLAWLAAGKVVPGLVVAADSKVGGWQRVVGVEPAGVQGARALQCATDVIAWGSVQQCWGEAGRLVLTRAVLQRWHGDSTGWQRTRVCLQHTADVTLVCRTAQAGSVLHPR
jgi:hypothetical protein